MTNLPRLWEGDLCLGLDQDLDLDLDRDLDREKDLDLDLDLESSLTGEGDRKSLMHPVY